MTPRIGVSFNQFNATDIFDTPIDFAWGLALNSPPLNWANVVRNSSAKRVILENGGIDRDQLLTGWGDPSKATIMNCTNAVAPLKANYNMCYYEGGGPTLIPSDIPIAYSMLNTPLVLLYRQYDRAHLDSTLLAYPVEVTYGAVFEFDPIWGLNNAALIAGAIDYVTSNKRTCFLLIPPARSSYVHDVMNCLKEIKVNSANFQQAVIVFAVYNRYQVGVTFTQVANAINEFRAQF